MKKKKIPSSNGAKFDDHKPRLDLIDPEFEISLGRILTYGVKIHGEASWKTIPNPEKRYLAALKRHTNAMARGEIVDSGTGESHAACIGINAMFLDWFQKNRTKDGYKGVILNLHISK